jgi:hypothetical protein
MPKSESLPAHRKLYDWFVNVAASVVIVLIWKFLAYWSARLGWVESEDHCLLMIVALSLALNIPSRRRTT